VFDAVPNGPLGTGRKTVDSMEGPWHRLEKRQVPRFLHRQMDDALDALQTAVDDRNAAGARQAALDVGMLASTWSCGPGRKPRLTGPASASGRISFSSTRRRPMLAPLPGTRSSSAASETGSADERCEAP